MGSTELQKIKKTVDNLYTEKQKLEKEKSKKGAAKGKSKASLRMDGNKVSILAMVSVWSIGGVLIVSLHTGWHPVVRHVRVRRFHVD